MFVPRTLAEPHRRLLRFRILDVWKPGPIGKADETIGGGVGVMADDLVAGVIGSVVMVALHYSGALPWAAARVVALCTRTAG